MIGTGILGLAPCGQTRSQECAQSCSPGAQGAAATWGGRRGRGRACCKKGRWIRDFCSKEKSKQRCVRAVTVSSRFRQASQDACRFSCQRSVQAYHRCPRGCACAHLGTASWFPPERSTRIQKGNREAQGSPQISLRSDLTQK